MHVGPSLGLVEHPQTRFPELVPADALLDGDGVEVTREIDIRNAGLDDTDTVLLYNGDDHYDSFVPYQGVVMGEEEEE